MFLNFSVDGFVLQLRSVLGFVVSVPECVSFDCFGIYLNVSEGGGVSEPCYRLLPTVWGTLCTHCSNKDCNPRLPRQREGRGTKHPRTVHLQGLKRSNQLYFNHYFRLFWSLLLCTGSIVFYVSPWSPFSWNKLPARNSTLTKIMMKYFRWQN